MPVRYLYLGIRAKGLMSVTSAHLMVKDAIADSSDPQGPGHASSDSEDEVSASTSDASPVNAMSSPMSSMLTSSEPSY